MPPRGPLGDLPGMFYDPDKNRYYPKSLLNRCEVGSKPEPPAAELAKPKRLARRQIVSGRRRDEQRTIIEDRASRLTHAGTERYCGCHGETVTSFKSYPTGGHYATTDHGKIVMHRPDGQAFQISICSQRLLGLHIDVANMSYVAVANGPDPHLHIFRRDPHNLEHFAVGQTDIDLPPSADIFSMASFGSTCTLAASRTLVVFQSGSPQLSKRHMPSDPLCVDHVDPAVVIAGLRSGAIVVDDTRVAVPPLHLTTVPRGRAVIGVKRLSDAAVPFGIVASALDNTLVLYDARFAASPVREFEHVNAYNTDLALQASPDSSIIYAAGSDCRVRAYSTITGAPILAHPGVESSPFGNAFSSRVSLMDVGANELRIANGPDVSRFTVGEPREEDI